MNGKNHVTISINTEKAGNKFNICLWVYNIHKGSVFKYDKDHLCMTSPQIP